MIESTERLQLPLLARILQGYYRTNLRGSTRTTLLLARYAKSLHAVPIRIADWPAVYVDLRLLNSHFWLIGTPFAHSPIEMDEQMVMRRFVREGDTVFDIGANFGVHTALLAQLTGPRGHVFTFGRMRNCSRLWPSPSRDCATPRTFATRCRTRVRRRHSSSRRTAP
jgi:hypothetical protein